MWLNPRSAQSENSLSPRCLPSQLCARLWQEQITGVFTLLDDRTTCFHPVVSQRLWPVIHHKTHHKHIIFLLWQLSICDRALLPIQHTNKTQLDVFCKSVLYFEQRSSSLQHVASCHLWPQSIQNKKSNLNTFWILTGFRPWILYHRTFNYQKLSLNADFSHTISIALGMEV